jgi:hypothetical protein
MDVKEGETCGVRGRSIPVVTDSFIARVSAQSVSLLERAVQYTEGETFSTETLTEDWFRRPFHVAERLADRLSLSEQCIKQQVSWAGYKELTEKLDLDF